MSAHHANIAGWLNDLAVLTAGSQPIADAKAKVAAYAGMLAEEYPAAAFSRASLRHVAERCKFFPSYAELYEALGGWWKDNRPRPVAITGDQPATIRQREIEREVHDSWANETADAVKARVANIEHGPFALAVGRALAAALGSHAPHHLPLLPLAWRTDPDNPASGVPPRKPDAPPPLARQFSREQLTTLYAKAGIATPQPKERPNAPA